MEIRKAVKSDVNNNVVRAIAKIAITFLFLDAHSDL